MNAKSFCLLLAGMPNLSILTLGWGSVTLLKLQGWLFPGFGPMRLLKAQILPIK